MDSRLFDMLHDAADNRGFAVGDGIDIHFDGVLEKLVDQDGMLRGDVDGGVHVTDKIPLIIDDPHGSATQNVRGTNHHRIADFLGDDQGRIGVVGNAVGRLAEVEFMQKLLKTLPVFGPINGIRGCPQDLDPGLSQGYGQIKRGLAAKLDDHPERFFLLNDIEDIFPGQRFEIETIGGVVIGRNRFRVGVDHNRFDSQLAQGKGGVNTAIIEFNALADSIGAAAQNHHLGPIAGPAFILGLVSGVIVRGVGFKFGGAGIHQFVNRFAASLRPQLANIIL